MIKLSRLRFLVWTSLLVPAISARAVGFHFEAWPTPSSEICTAPCYQVRMFLDVDPWLRLQEIQSLQMDVNVREGAVLAEIFTPPEENNGNSGDGTVRVNRPTGIGTKTRTDSLPWGLSSTVARSPRAGFDVLMVHAAAQPFTLESWSAIFSAPGSRCVDDDALCDFVGQALAQDRIYLGFFNITQSDPLIYPGPGFPDPFHNAVNTDPYSAGAPYFAADVGNVTGDGPLLEYLSPLGSGHVPFLPEPSALLLLGAVLLAVAGSRRVG